MILPVLCLLMFGAIRFGIILNNYIQLSDGVGAAVRQLSISRATGSGTPFSGTKAAFQNAAPGLTTAQTTLTFTVNGTACTADGACSTALTNDAGDAAKVVATYPCTMKIMTVVWKSCTMTSTAQEVIQ